MIRETYCLHLQGFVPPSRWRWSSSCRTLVQNYQTTWHNTLEDSDIQSPMWQSLISQCQDIFQHDRLMNPIIWKKYSFWVLGLKVQFEKQYSKTLKRSINIYSIGHPVLSLLVTTILNDTLASILLVKVLQLRVITVKTELYSPCAGSLKCHIPQTWSHILKVNYLYMKHKTCAHTCTCTDTPQNLHNGCVPKSRCKVEFMLPLASLTSIFTEDYFHLYVRCSFIQIVS